MGIIKAPLQNQIQKQLAATLAAGATSMTLNEDVSALFSGVSADNPGVCVIDRIDSNGTATPSKREYIKFTGVSGASLTGLTRNADSSGTDQEHSVGAIVEFVSDVLFAKSVLDTFDVEHNADGTHDTTKVVTPTGTQTLTNKTLTSPVINTPTGDVVTLTGTQTLTNKTLTSPVVNGAMTGTVTPPLTFYGANFNPPEGYLINGKIVPSVTSNNLTVALKGLDGNDPSATNPVYVRIGDTVRAITGALSVTVNAGTNWFNAGSSELATKEIDYFVYLGYNATDGVVIGFARIPYATDYSQFSTTTTNEKYCAISTITNAASGDDYTIIGRFAATLSAGAGYTWTVPTFTTINLIQRPIYETRWLVWSPTHSTSGTGYTNSPTTPQSNYKIKDVRVITNVILVYNATSGGTGFSKITTPFQGAYNYQAGVGVDASNGVALSVIYNGGILWIAKYDSTTPIISGHTLGIYADIEV